MSQAFDKTTLEELYSTSKIREQVDILAKRIAQDYAPILKQEGRGFRLILVGVLSGAEPFLSDLARALSAHFPLGYIEKEYVALSSYRDGLVSGAVRFLLDTKQPLTDAHVLVVEDIVDTGKTLAHLISLLEARLVKSLKVCVLIDKVVAREKEVQTDYVGFRTEEDLWLIGYGLDYNAKGRELPNIQSIHFEA